MNGNLLPFVAAGVRLPSLWQQEIIDPMDAAEFDVQAAAADMAEIIHRDIGTIDEALTMTRRVEVLIVLLQDVQQLALAKAARCR